MGSKAYKRCLIFPTQFILQYHLQCVELEKSREFGCAWLARHPGKDTEGSANTDDVILLYLDMFLIR
jgi:hypothetical protein